MAGIAIGVATLVLGTAGAAEGAHEAHVAANSQKNAQHKQEASLLAQQQAAEQANAAAKEKQANAASLYRQKSLNAAGGGGGGDFGGTLGAGSGNPLQAFSGASKTLLGT